MILQINMNHCRLAHDLLNQTVMKYKADIVIISDPLYNPGGWLMNDSRTAAIWFTGVNYHQFLVDEVNFHETFVMVKVVH